MADAGNARQGGCILVTGAAGYVGTHVLYELIQAGYTPIALDNRQSALDDAESRIHELTGTKVHTVCVDLLDKDAITTVFQNACISHVLHLAGLKAVRQSHGSPLAFYNINVISTLNLLQVMAEQGVYNIIFSSSSKVYGKPQYLPLDEAHPTGQCTNPYGRTKYMVEQIIQDLAKSDQRWKVIVLRYFNPCGAHTSGRLGEDKNLPPTNLMPTICHVALGKLEHLTVYGSDYDTTDGTACKAYIHVVDLAKGHIAALRYSHNKEENYKVFNLGTSEMCSILGMVQMFEKASGKKIRVKFCDRKPGEIAECCADNTQAVEELSWAPHITLQQMCEDMWRWMSNSDDVSQNTSQTAGNVQTEKSRNCVHNNVHIDQGK